MKTTTTTRGRERGKEKKNLKSFHIVMGKWHRYYSILEFDRNRKLNFTVIEFCFTLHSWIILYLNFDTEIY